MKKCAARAKIPQRRAPLKAARRVVERQAAPGYLQHSQKAAGHYSCLSASMHWSVAGAALCFVLVAGVRGVCAQTGAQSPSPATSAATTSAFAPILRNVTRVESWSFFEPPPGGGDPDYTFVANRLLAGFSHARSRHEFNAALQYVQFGGLPDNASGPGALGTGANYFAHNRRSDSRRVYLKSLNVLFRRALPGLNVRLGRMGYASGGEAPSGNPAIEALKRMRLDSRLVGEFEWSIYQRAFDGVRGDWTRDRLQVTGTAFWPTQGGFDERAGASLRDVRILSAVATLKPSLLLSRTEVQVFAHHYADDRPVTGRPDNTTRRVSRADVGYLTSGAHVAGVYPMGRGSGDVLAWSALQRGDWYESAQRAWAVALEGGFQWTDSPWAPWLRVGWNRASGDADPEDLSHRTFMPPLPTARKYSLSTAYTFMNLDDLFVQALLKPRPEVNVRADVHRLRLVQPNDLWYAGSGATRRQGAIFGYAGRRSGGVEDLGTIIEGSVDWTINRRWSINGYLGRMAAGDVVRSTFAGDRLTFGYVENVIRF
jgi:hypothetical protein